MTQYSTVDTVAKPNPELIADMHSVLMKDMVESTRNIDLTQFEKYTDTTYTTGSPENFTNGFSGLFTINASGGQIIDFPPGGGTPIYDPVTGILTFVEDGLYTVIIEINIDPSNSTGEVRFNLNIIQVETGASTAILGAGQSMDNVDTGGGFSKMQAVFIMVGREASLGYTYEINLEVNEFDCDIADRSITILRSM